MTLVEVLVATVILSILAGGLFSGVMQTRRASEFNIYQSSAINAAASYIEQIKSMPYHEVRAAIYDQASTPLPTMLDGTTTDPIYLNQVNQKSIIINTDQNGNATEILELDIIPQLIDLDPSLNMEGVVIRILYRYRSPLDRTVRLGWMRTVRSNVETY